LAFDFVKLSMKLGEWLSSKNTFDRSARAKKNNFMCRAGRPKKFRFFGLVATITLRFMLSCTKGHTNELPQP